MTAGRGLVAGAVLAAVAMAATPALAQMDDDSVVPARDFESPERFALEVRIGPYSPDMGRNTAFDAFFSDEIGPLLALEFDVILWRMPKVLSVAGGGGIGRANFTGFTRSTLDAKTTEETGIELIPLNLLAVLRIDALSRLYSIPFNFAGKLGYQWMHWDAESGGRDDADGWSRGLLWGAQLALDLDTFEPRQARMLDEEWGINHSFLFFEFFGFEPSSRSLEVGGLQWAAGLGFVM